MSRSGQDAHMGLYRKFQVTRHDPTGKHANCFYFVLDCDHDEFAIPALEAYVEACKEKFPALASDLHGVIAMEKVKRAGEHPAPSVKKDGHVMLNWVEGDLLGGASTYTNADAVRPQREYYCRTCSEIASAYQRGVNDGIESVARNK